MQIGRFKTEQLSEGIFEVYKDGVFAKVDASLITSNKPDDFSTNYSTTIGIDPILVYDENNVILLDTGLGWGLDAKSSYQNTSNLKTNLDIFGFTPEDVTHVLLTHLHFDHAAGCSFVNSDAHTQPSLPNATYFVQKKEWEYALQSSEKTSLKGAGYELDELYRLVADKQFHFIEDDFFEVIPGINLIWTGGHTPGHQIVQIKDAAETAYYLGDLVPTEYHLNQYAMKNLDTDPVQAKKAKILLLRQALREQAYLMFYHSKHTKAGRLERDKNRKLVLKKID